jgi:hypothetical protein
MFFLQAGVFKHRVVGKEEVGKGGHQVAWLEGRMGEVTDIVWESHRGWAVLRVVFSHSFL